MFGCFLLLAERLAALAGLWTGWSPPAEWMRELETEILIRNWLFWEGRWQATPCDMPERPLT